MSAQKKVPEEPSDLSKQNLKFLRFVDPEDSTKIFELAAVDTGNPAGDGTRRYSLVTGGIGGPSPSLPKDLPANPSFTLDGSAQQLPDVDLVAGVVLRNRSSNDDSIWVGGDNTVDTNDGFELEPGETLPLAVNNLNLVWVKGTNTEMLDWIGG